MACESQNELAEANCAILQPENDTADDLQTEENPRKSAEICKFHLNGKCRFAAECRNLHVKTSQGTSSPPSSPRSKLNSPRKSRQQQDEQITGNEKRKSSMKTAENVINRIIWDEKLPEDMFTIGYLDRFVGIIEKPFQCFCWEPLSSVDNTVLAIPKHRIQFFKYKGAKVWDKNERLDKVFGSTGYLSTIYQFIDEIDENDEENDDLALSLLDCDITESSSNYSSSKTRSKLRITHFICVRISDSSITKKFESIKKQIIRYEPEYADCFGQVPNLHVTLATLHLDNAGAIQDTEKILNDVTKTLNTLPLMKLTLQGLDIFHGCVLYAKIQPQNTDFNNLVSDLIKKLKTSEINVIVDHPTYTPHLTLMKTSPLLAEKRLIDPVLLTDLRDEYLGIQHVNNLSLYSTKTDENGCYHCISDTNITGIEI